MGHRCDLQLNNDTTFCGICKDLFRFSLDPFPFRAEYLAVFFHIYNAEPPELFCIEKRICGDNFGKKKKTGV